MAFWGVEVKPGQPFTHFFDSVRGRLHISQATLGTGTAIRKSLVQCNVGNKRPVYLCSLLPDKNESLSLNLEFEEADEVTFSVIGPRSVYLTGYYQGNGRHSNLNNDSDSYGIDIENTESEKSTHSSDKDEYGGSFIDDDNDPEIHPASSFSSDDLVVEAKQDDKKLKEGKDHKRPKKKDHLSESDDDNCSQQHKTFNTNTGLSALEIEDEDTLPISSLSKIGNTEKNAEMEAEEKANMVMTGMGKKAEDDGNDVTKAKSKPDATGVDLKPEGRQSDRLFISLPPSTEVAGSQNVARPEKKRKRHSEKRKTLKDNTANCSSVVKEDKMKEDGDKYNSLDQDLPSRYEQDQRTSNDKGVVLPCNLSIPSIEANPKKGMKPKNKMEEQAKEGKTLLEVDDAYHGKDLEENNDQNDGAKADSVSQDLRVRHERDEKLATDKDENSMNCTLMVLNPVVLEEKQDDKKSKEVKVHKRLKKKDHLSESDDDKCSQQQKTFNTNTGLSALEIEDEDILPISSLCKIGNTEKNAEMEAEEKANMVMAGMGKEAEDDGNDVTKARSRPDAAGIDVKLEGRRSDHPYYSLPPPTEVAGSENVAKPAKKIKRHTEKRKTLKYNTANCSNVTEEDKMKEDKNRACRLDQDLPPTYEEDQKTANDQGVVLPCNLSIPSTEVDPEKGMKPNNKMEEQAEGKTPLEVDDAYHGNDLEENNDQKDGAKADSVSQDLLMRNERDEKLATDNQKHHEKKRMKKICKTEENKGDLDMHVLLVPMDEKNRSVMEMEDGNVDVKSTKVRTLSSGLIIEELEMGKPEGNPASLGKRVSVYYIGKLKDNGQIVDSNVGEAPFKFRLGAGKVIEGFEVGLDGMHVGDKRRLIIPPSMGFGSQGNGDNIPPDSWLVYDIDLVKVR